MQHLQSKNRASQMDALLVLPVIQDHIEAAGHGDDELMQVLLSAAAPPKTS
jgi:hypothetical protein